MFPYAVTGGADYKPEAWGFVRFSWEKSGSKPWLWIVFFDHEFADRGAVYAVVDDFGNLVRVEG